MFLFAIFALVALCLFAAILADYMEQRANVREDELTGWLADHHLEDER